MPLFLLCDLDGKTVRLFPRNFKCRLGILNTTNKNKSRRTRLWNLGKSGRPMSRTGSSSAGKKPRHIVIPGDYTEVDVNSYQSNFDSHKVENNIIENSFDSY
jgi:hypothetical protein